MNLKNLYIITGTSSGIGKSILEALLENPINEVIGISRNNSTIHPSYTHVTLDLSNISDVKKFKFPNSTNYSKISLINNAGTLGEINTLDKINLESLDQTNLINYTAPMLLATEFIQKYQSAHIQKIIINLSSGAATSPYASWSNYCASKAALEMFTKCIHKEQEDQSHPILAFSIAPGVVNTNMQAYIRSTKAENFKMKSKFIELYEQNQLYDANSVAQKIIDVTLEPTKYKEQIFRILI